MSAPVLKANSGDTFVGVGTQGSMRLLAGGKREPVSCGVPWPESWCPLGAGLSRCPLIPALCSLSPSPGRQSSSWRRWPMARGTGRSPPPMPVPPPPLTRHLPGEGRWLRCRLGFVLKRGRGSRSVPGPAAPGVPRGKVERLWPPKERSRAGQDSTHRLCRWRRLPASPALPGLEFHSLLLTPLDFSGWELNLRPDPEQRGQ